MATKGKKKRKRNPIENFGDKLRTQGFDKNPENAGRPKKTFTLVKDAGYTKDDAKRAFKALAFLSLTELEEIANDKTKPAILPIVAKALIKAHKTGDYFRGERIFEMFMGKPDQKFDNDNSDVKVIVEYVNEGI